MKKEPRGVFVPPEILERTDLRPAMKLLLGLMENLSRNSGIAYASPDTYADRLGIHERTVRRALRDLETLGLIVLLQSGGGRENTATYRLALDTEKPGQIAPLSGDGNPDKIEPKPGQVVHGNPDKSGQKPGQLAPQVKKSKHMSGEGEKEAPASGAHGTRNENNHGEHQDDQDAALLNVAEEARGRPLTPKESPAFLQAVAEAREAKATDAEIADGIRTAGPSAAPWTGPNAARDAACDRVSRLLASYQCAVRLPRKTIAEIITDVNYARRRMAQTPHPEPGDEAVALWQSQLAWADRNAADLAAASACEPNLRLAQRDDPEPARPVD